MPRVQNLRDLRTEVLNELQRSKAPLTLLQLSKNLRIPSDTEDYLLLRNMLNILADEGLVVRHARRRYSTVKDINRTLSGRFTYYHDKATVATSDPDVPVVHIRPQHLSTALDGDVVSITLHATIPGKKVYGEVTGVLKRSMQPIAGTIEFDGSFYYLIPDESRYHVDFLIAPENLKGAKPGDKVVGAFIRWKHAKAVPEARINEVLGTSGQAAVEFRAILKEFNLPTAFAPEVESEAAQHNEPSGIVPPGRLDLTNELVITIDPVDARDFDDALSLTPLSNGGVELGVHIADVSHYVPEHSAVDREALRRGTSTYLVNQVVPMLPEILSNNICSLVPGKPRFAYSVFMQFSATGLLRKYRIAETVITSKRRYTYEEAQDIINSVNVKANGSKLSEEESLVLGLYRLSRVLYNRRIKHGGIDFETQEVKYVLDENLKPIRALVKTRTDATSLVEECMLAANRVVAEHVQKLGKEWKSPSSPPLVYRIHEEPNPEKLADAVRVIRALGIDVPNGRLTPVQVNNVLTAVQNKPEKSVVNTLLLRAMAKAVYAEYNVGHYGLGFTAYAHFTSPIRRYPDLFVHRALKEYAKGKPNQERWVALSERAGKVSDHSSVTERGAVDAERASQKLAQAMMAREHLGEHHDGYVTGVTNFGVFVMLNELMCEGLLHIRDLDDDFYFFDEQRYRLVGRKHRRILQYGTILRVRIARVDMIKRMIDFSLAPTEEQQ